MTDERPVPQMPPRAVLYGVYAVLFLVLIAVFVLAGVYV